MRNISINIFLFLATFLTCAFSERAQPPSPTQKTSAVKPSSTRASERFIDVTWDTPQFSATIPQEITTSQREQRVSYLLSTIPTARQEVAEEGIGALRIFYFILAGIGGILVLGSFLLLFDFPKYYFAGAFLVGAGLIVPVVATTDLQRDTTSMFFDNATNSPATIEIDGAERFTLNPKSNTLYTFYKHYQPDRTASVDIRILNADKTEKEHTTEKIDMEITYPAHWCLYNIGKANTYWEVSQNYKL